MRAEVRQRSLTEALVGANRAGARLDRIAALLGWSALEARLGGPTAVGRTR
jgi:hypothetical protein